MDGRKKPHARAYFLAFCGACRAHINDKDGNKYHATRAKAVRLGTEHAVAVHIRIETQRLKITRQVKTTVEAVA